MRNLLLIISCLLTSFSFCQSLTDKYLHYRTDYYWDGTLYKSEQDFFYENNKGKLTRKTYPVLEYFFTQIITDSPFVTRDSSTRRDHSSYPYKYIRKRNSIYLQYFDLGRKKLRLHKEYSLIISDTVKWLANKYSLDSKNGISVAGRSTYLGEEKVEVNGKTFTTFKFLEEYDEVTGPHSIVIFLDQAALIPVKIVPGRDYPTIPKNGLYYIVTSLASSGNTLPDYTNTKTTDLVLYENKSTTWTEKEKEYFMKMFEPGKKQYAECLLQKLDGHISFFFFRHNNYFKRLVSSNECEEK
jgi:hypothetical protein